MCDTFLSASQPVVVLVVWQGQVTCDVLSDQSAAESDYSVLRGIRRVEYIFFLGGFGCEVKGWMALHVVSLYPTLAAHTSPTNHTCTYMHTHVFTHTCACTHPYPVLGTVLCVCFWFTADTVIWKEEEEKEDQIGGTVTSVRRVYECTFFSVCEQWFPVSLWSYCTYII